MKLRFSPLAAPPLLLFALLTGLVPARAGTEKIWHIKAIHPEGRVLDVKAFGKDGQPMGVKALQLGNNLHCLDVKAVAGEARFSVKILPKREGDVYFPVKAIAADGTIYDIKALTPEGLKLDVKGVAEDGTITAIKAIGLQGDFYGIKAISPEGRVYDVKGLKLGSQSVEGKVGPVDFAAHVKALPQAP
jgi:hypothetical protein